jgi:hypothetical protein
MEGRMPLLDRVSELIKWVDLHGHRHPREVKSTLHTVDVQERESAKTLRLCKSREKQGKLPEEASRKLDEVRCKTYDNVYCRTRRW